MSARNDFSFVGRIALINPLMIDHSIEIAGIVIPSTRSLFLVTVAVHVAAGIFCVLSGLIAMLSQKVRGKHTRAGVAYYRSLIVVCSTMTVLAIMRWPEDNVLWILGAGAFAGALLARRSITHRTAWRIRLHILGMGCSYTLLLVAFYVDNGKQLPVWKELPPILYWLLPVAIALPLIGQAVWRHPLAQGERLSTTTRP